MPEIPIEFPFGGLNEDQTPSDQPRRTSREAVNVRGLVQSGRLQGGPRDGHSLVIATSAPGGGPIRLLSHTTVNRSGSTYAANASGTTEWMATSPQSSDKCRGVKLDRQRNVYALDGLRGIAKFNSAGELVWKFVVAVLATGQTIRALEVDVDTGAIYVGVSEGGVQAEAKIYKYLPKDDGASEPNPEWEITPGGYCEKLKIRNGVLYAALNFPDVRASKIAAYRLIDTAVPEEAWVRDQVPYPTNDLDVRPTDGAIFTAHPLNATRSYHGKSPDTRKVAVDAEPRDFVNDYETYAWCELDASDIDGDGTLNGEYENGDGIPLVIDRTGNNRNAFEPTTVYGSNPANYVLPLLQKERMFGGQDCLLFGATTSTYASTHSGLVSAENSVTTSEGKFGQRTLIPAYSGATYTVITVARGTSEVSPRVVWAQDDSRSGDPGRALIMNTRGLTATSVQSDALGAGNVMFQDANSAAFGTGNSLYDGTTGFSIAVCTVSATHSFLYSNGSPTGTSCTTSATTATEATQLGRYTTSPNGTTASMTNAGPFNGGLAYFASFDKVFTSAERVAYEGYLAWRFGIAHRLASGHPYENYPPTVTSVNSAYWSTSSPYVDLTRTEPMVVKWSPDGADPMWVLRDTSAASAGQAIGGLGYGVACSRYGSPWVWSVGTSAITAPSGWTAAQTNLAQSVVRQIVDEGQSRDFNSGNTATWQDRWGTSSSYEVPTYQYPRLAVSGIAPNQPDEHSAAIIAQEYLYVPVHGTTSLGPGVYVYNNAPGTSLASTSFTYEPLTSITVATSERCYACDVPPERPAYTPGQVSILRDEHLAVGSITDDAGSGTSTVSYIRLVNETRSNVPPRYSFTLAGTSTDLYRADTAWTSLPGGPSAIRSSGYVMATQLQNRFYVTDGSNYKRVDPRMAGEAQVGAVTTWKSKGSGEIPKRQRLITTWRQRIVLARGHDDPTNWYMSAIGDPENWDFFPPVQSASQAVAGSTQLAGRSLGVVNALMPLSDDLLYIGCDQGILRLTGDPASEGQLDLVTDSIGMSFGEPWCRDPEGRAYFFGSRGGVYVAVPGSPLQSISDNAIRRRLQDIDLSVFYIRLVWDWRADGLHVYLCPFDTGTAPSTAYFWERKTGAWYQDELPFVVKSACLGDGDDPDDRVVLLGCQDGFLRYVDENAVSDGGTPIYARVTIGPMAVQNAGSQFRFSRPRISLASNLGGCEVAMLASDTADVPGSEVEWQYVLQGQNDTLAMQARGNFVWIKLRSGDALSRWAFENGAIRAERAGMRRRIS